MASSVTSSFDSELRLVAAAGGVTSQGEKSASRRLVTSKGLVEVLRP